MIASSPAVAAAASAIRVAADHIAYALVPLTQQDFDEYLTPAMQQLQLKIIAATKVAAPEPTLLLEYDKSVA